MRLGRAKASDQSQGRHSQSRSNRGKEGEGAIQLVLYQPGFVAHELHRAILHPAPQLEPLGS